MIVYDVVLNEEVKETIVPVYSDLVSLYHIMRDIYLPEMTRKYGRDAKLKRRLRSRPKKRCV